MNLHVRLIGGPYAILETDHKSVCRRVSQRQSEIFRQQQDAV